LSPADSKAANRRTLDDLLAALAPMPVRARAMFGGFGLYMEDRFFGLISDGVVYFRADDESRPAYEERGMTAFHPNSRPRGPGTVGRNFRVPPEVLEEAVLLREWAGRAAAAKRIRR
jgi:DNA transformation protein